MLREETMDKVFAFFEGKAIDVLGVGSFGPIDLIKDSETYGYITSTPKKHWANYDLVGNLRKKN